MYEPQAKFFDTVRGLFGRLTSEQVAAMERIIQYLMTHGVTRVQAAYILATIKHETANWMVPIREGARRYGRNYTDAQSRQAIAVAVAKGLIRTNYALPDPRTGHAYYGRGLVQITWPENYIKLGEAIGADLFNNPDLALEWEQALAITVVGMKNGLFTGKSLSVLDEDSPNYVLGRAIINGDTRRYGAAIAKDAETFYEALDGYEMEEKHEPASAQGAWPPRWWPLRSN